MEILYYLLSQEMTKNPDQSWCKFMDHERMKGLAGLSKCQWKTYLRDDKVVPLDCTCNQQSKDKEFEMLTTQTLHLNH